MTGALATIFGAITIFSGAYLVLKMESITFPKGNKNDEFPFLLGFFYVISYVCFIVDFMNLFIFVVWNGGVFGILAVFSIFIVRHNDSKKNFAKCFVALLPCVPYYVFGILHLAS